MSAARRCLIPLLIAGLSACATVQPRFHSDVELAKVARKCGVASTEVAQSQANPELLFLLTPDVNDNQLDCVTRWASRRHLRLVYIASFEREPPKTEP